MDSTYYMLSTCMAHMYMYIVEPNTAADELTLNRNTFIANTSGYVPFGISTG